LEDVILHYVIGRDKMAGQSEILVGARELQHLKGKSLGDLLSQLPGGFVKTYGSGSLATASLQGMSASQTQVTWMGVPVNSPSLGMTDLALFPTELIGRASIVTGSAAQESGSGALGGAIGLGGITHFGPPGSWDGTASLGAGNFGRYDGSLMLHRGNNHWWVETRAVYKQAENNYPYRDLTVFGTPQRRLEHAAFRQGGIAQDWIFRSGKRNEWGAHVWWLDSQREIPPIMGASATDETQHDRNFRASLSLRNKFNRFSLTHSATYLQDLNHYLNPTYGIDGLNRFRSVVGQSQFSTDRLLPQKWIFSGYLRYRLDQSQTDGWEGMQNRQTLTGYSRALWLPSPRVNLSVAMQQENVDGKWMPTLPLAGIWYGFNPKENTEAEFFRGWAYANVGRNFRMPTLNDLYWVPGGNTQLVPERSWKAQLGGGLFPLADQTSWMQHIRVKGEVFASLVQDWILWQPSGLGYWQAQNVQEVFARGGLVEIGARSTHLPSEAEYSSRLSWAFNTFYSLTLSEAIPAGESFLGGKGTQLIYVPRHQAQARLQLQWHRWQLQATPQYTGLRYITSDESQSLAGFFLLDAKVSVGIGKPKRSLRLSLQGENLLNAQYQAVAFRPMAGRTVLLRLDWIWNRPPK
jgi:iron complex outermembrane receptor protein